MSEDEADLTLEGPLPEMRSAVLTSADLDSLFNDLAACAEIQSIRLKSSGRQAADETSVSLDDARSLLTGGGTHGVQIRYVYQGREYLDTLLRTDGGFRLVRL